MDVLIQGLRWSHIALGFVGLAAFWVPVVSKKGGERHKAFGKVFALCAYVVAVTAMLTPPLRIGRALADGASVSENSESFGFLIFLFYLGSATLALTRHAVKTIRTKRDPDSIRTAGHILIGVLPTVGSVLVVAWALIFWSPLSIIMLALSPVGVLTSADIFKYMYRRPPEKRAWFYAHMGAMLGAGIAFHTAFLVFGSRVIIDLSVLGSFNWVPWVLPALIGTVGGGYWERQYRRKFGDVATKDVPAPANV